VRLTDGVVLLRDWSVEDAGWFATTAAGDELIQRYTTLPPTLTESEVRAALARREGRGDAAGFCLCDPGGEQRWGSVAADLVDGVGHVSYWLAPPARGRGVATAALRLLVDWLFEAWPVTELRLWTHAGNAASQGVAERAGFHRDPLLDESREIKGGTWPLCGYRLTRPSSRPPAWSAAPTVPG
jgi:[ribosomal protein S5]-alanine N-acetyltransferase